MDLSTGRINSCFDGNATGCFGCAPLYDFRFLTENIVSNILVEFFNLSFLLIYIRHVPTLVGAGRPLPRPLPLKPPPMGGPPYPRGGPPNPPRIGGPPNPPRPLGGPPKPPRGGPALNPPPNPKNRNSLKSFITSSILIFLIRHLVWIFSLQSEVFFILICDIRILNIVEDTAKTFFKNRKMLNTDSNLVVPVPERPVVARFPLTLAPVPTSPGPDFEAD